MDRNWLDIGVILIVAVFTLTGLTSGFVFSTFRIIATTISLFLSLGFYGRLTEMLYGTFVEEVLGNFIYDGFRSNTAINAAQRN